MAFYMRLLDLFSNLVNCYAPNSIIQAFHTRFLNCSFITTWVGLAFLVGSSLQFIKLAYTILIWFCNQVENKTSWGFKTVFYLKKLFFYVFTKNRLHEK